MLKARSATSPTDSTFFIAQEGWIRQLRTPRIFYSAVAGKMHVFPLAISLKFKLCPVLEPLGKKIRIETKILRLKQAQLETILDATAVCLNF